MQALQHGPTPEETTRFKAKWMQFIRRIIKEICILVYRHDLRRQGMSERVISAKASWAGKQMSGVAIRDICSRTADKLQYGRDELQILIGIWERLSSHPVGENDLWFYTHWLKDERVSGEDRDKAFETGLDLIQRWIQRQHNFQVGSLVRRAIERASWGTGDAKPLLIFIMLGPEDKAAFLDHALRGIDIEPLRDDADPEIQDGNQARGSGEDP